jgi:hypothetical protein
MTARCRSCQAPVIWAVSASGRPMPLDPDPRPDGTLILIETDPPTALRVGDGSKEAQTAARRQQPRYAAHFASCPDAAKWRRRSRR